MENMYEYYKFMNDIYFRKEVDKDYFEVLNKDGEFEEVIAEINRIKGSGLSR